jgi:signal peptidase
MDITLTNSLAAIRRNDRISARNLLRQYVAGQPEDPAGWYLLSQIAEGPAEGLQCLQRVLETAPIALKAGPVAPTATKEPPEHRSKPITAYTTPRGRMQPVMRRVLTAASYSLIAGVLCVLAAAILPMFFGQKTLVILSGSMAPTIAAGSAVVVSPVPSARLTEGDVIVYAPEGAKVPVVHRIVSIGEADGARQYMTRGDANGSNDPAGFSLPETAWRVWYSVPLVGYVITFAASRAGMVLLVVVPALWLGILQVVEWFKTHRREQWLRLSGRRSQVMRAISHSPDTLRQEGRRRMERLQLRLKAQPHYGTGLQLIAAWFKIVEFGHHYRTHVAAQWVTAGRCLRRDAQHTARWIGLRLEPLSDANITAWWHKFSTESMNRFGIAVQMRPGKPLRLIKWPRWLYLPTGPRTGEPEPS